LLRYSTSTVANLERWDNRPPQRVSRPDSRGRDQPVRLQLVADVAVEPERQKLVADVAVDDVGHAVDVQHEAVHHEVTPPPPRSATMSNSPLSRSYARVTATTSGASPGIASVQGRPS